MSWFEGKLAIPNCDREVKRDDRASDRNNTGCGSQEIC